MIIGIDEAGRGPLAGPVAVGAVIVPQGFDVATEFPGVADSKALSEKKREVLFEMLLARVALGDVRYHVQLGSHSAIDERGIAKVIRESVATALTVLAPKAKDVEVLLDGALAAPPEYRQQVIIHGDALVPIISLASIAAKVVRDRLMKEYEKEFPGYGFEKHKGYPTRFHYDRIAELGPCAIHRRSYLSFTEASLD